MTILAWILAGVAVLAILIIWGPRLFAFLGTAAGFVAQNIARVLRFFPATAGLLARLFQRAFQVGVRGATIGAVIVVGLAWIATLVGVAALVIGLTWHSRGAILAGGGALIGAALLVGYFARLVLGYFRLVAQAGSEVLNFVLRVIARIFKRLKFLGPNESAPQIVDILPGADARLRHAMFTVVVGIGLFTLGLVPYPSWLAFTEVTFLGYTAFVVVAMSIAWVFSTQIGRSILVKSALVMLLAGSVVYVLTIAQYLAPDHPVRLAQYCGTHPIRCGAAAIRGKRSDAMLRAEQERLSDLLTRHYRGRLAHLRERFENGLRNGSQQIALHGRRYTFSDYVQDRGTLVAERNRNLRALWAQVSGHRKLSVGKRVELGAALAFWALLAGFLLWALIRIIRVRLWPAAAVQPAAPAPAQPVVERVSPEPVRAYNRLALVMLALFVVGTVAAILLGRRGYKSDKPEKPPVAEAPASERVEDIDALQGGSAASAPSSPATSEAAPAAACPDERLCPEAREARFAAVSCGRRIAHCQVLVARRLRQEASERYPY